MTEHEGGGAAKIPRTRLGRALELGRLAASVGRSVAGGGLARLAAARTDADRAREIDALLSERVAEQAFSVLSRMKGLALKAGQLAATSADLVPEEYRPAMRRVLGRLYDRADPLAFASVRAVIEQDLGCSPDKVFTRLEETPMAAASIGQVHRGVLRTGEDVAVKVQYPDVARAIEGDLANMGLVKRVLGRVLRADVEQTFDDLRARVLEECDYRREAANQERFRALFANDTAIQIARTFPEASGARVLTMELVSGLRLAEMVDRPQAERDAAGVALYRFVWGALLRHGLVYADPHPGNFFFRPDEGRVVVMDFGCVQEMEGDFVALTRRMHRAAMEGRPEVVRELFAAALDADPTDAEMDLIESFLIDYVYRPFARDAEFTFDDTYVREVIDWTWKGKTLALKNIVGRGTREPKRAGVVWLNRILVGLNNILAALRSRASFHRIHAALCE